MLSLRKACPDKARTALWHKANRLFYRRLGINKPSGRRWFINYARTTGKVHDTYACLRLCAARGDPFAKRNLATLMALRLG